MKNFKLYSLLTALCFFALYSCIKDNTVPVDTSYAETEADVEDAYAESDGVTQSAMTFYNVGGRAESDADSLISCATKTIDQVNKTITIDFGTGCQGIGGRVRKGKIIITYTDRLFLPGSVVTITYDNFYINGKKVEGIRTLTNVSASLDVSPKFHITLTDGKVTWPDSTYATRVSDFTATYTRALNPLNDETSVEGTAGGTNRKGTEYTMDIKTALVYKNICRLNRVFIPVSGIKEIQAKGQTMTVDYGDGTCDRTVTITVNGESRTIEATKGK
jgi:hypothetical protein